MKTIFVFALAAGLLQIFLSSTYAHEGNRLVPIVELTDADLALIDLQDGSIEDWFAVVGDPTLTAIEFFSREGRPYDPADMDFRIWLAWHDATNRIYGAMERTDDIYVNYYDTNAFYGTNPFIRVMDQHDSSLMLRVDGDHSGGTFIPPSCCPTEKSQRIYSVQAQEYEAISELPNGGNSQVTMSKLIYFGSLDTQISDWYTIPPYAEASGGHFGENPIITVTEFYITPFDWMVWDSEEESLVSDLSPGRTIGFTLSVIDIDDRAILGGHPMFFFPEGSLFTTSADNFADGFLLGPGGALPEEEDTAVESVTWGRIKTGFSHGPAKME